MSEQTPLPQPDDAPDLPPPPPEAETAGFHVVKLPPVTEEERNELRQKAEGSQQSGLGYRDGGSAPT